MTLTTYCGLKVSANEAKRQKEMYKKFINNTIPVAVLVEDKPVGIIRAPKKDTQAFCERAVRANMFTGQPLYPGDVVVSYKLMETGEQHDNNRKAK